MDNYKFSQEDVRQHLTMQQDIINRMASNSSNCKTWLVTIIAALTALQISMAEIVNYGWLLIIIIIAFWYLDAFYLALERIHRDNEKQFVNSLSEKQIPDTIYSFSTRSNKNKVCLTIKAMLSTSCWPFYVLFAVMTIALSWGGIICDFVCNLCK